jgi:hypothetical protein
LQVRTATVTRDKFVINLLLKEIVVVGIPGYCVLDEPALLRPNTVPCGTTGPLPNLLAAAAARRVAMLNLRKYKPDHLTSDGHHPEELALHSTCIQRHCN